MILAFVEVGRNLKNVVCIKDEKMSSVIGYEKIKAFLSEATLFELSRFYEILGNELHNPERVAVVRNQFKEGDIIEYFNGKVNRVLSAVVLQKAQTGVLVKNCADGRDWKIGYHRVKLNGRDFVFSQKQGQLDRNSLAIGDRVGFDYEGRQVTGIIERLNGKTVSLRTAENKKWRVAYAYLYSVIDGERGVSVRGVGHAGDLLQVDGE